MITANKNVESIDNANKLRSELLLKGTPLYRHLTVHENIFDMPEDILSKAVLVLRKVAKSLDKISDGINIGQNNRLAANQLVNHFHFHVIPRFENDGLKHWPGKIYNESEGKSVAEKIRENLE